MDTLESVLVHITGSDVPLAPPASLPKRSRTSLYSITTDQITENNGAALLLADAPSRIQASVMVSGTAGDTVILSSNYGDAQQGHGATVPVGVNLVITSSDQIWVGNGTVTGGKTDVIGVVAEYAE